MKLSFSILHWKNKSWQDLCEAASDSRMAGIELADISGELFCGRQSPANPERAAATRRALADRSLALPLINTGNDLLDTDFDREFTEALEIAVNLGVPCIGVHTTRDDDDALSLIHI